MRIKVTKKEIKKEIKNYFDIEKFEPVLSTLERLPDTTLKIVIFWGSSTFYISDWRNNKLTEKTNNNFNLWKKVAQKIKGYREKTDKLYHEIWDCNKEIRFQHNEIMQAKKKEDYKQISISLQKIEELQEKKEKYRKELERYETKHQEGDELCQTEKT